MNRSVISAIFGFLLTVPSIASAETYPLTVVNLGAAPVTYVYVRPAPSQYGETSWGADRLGSGRIERQQSTVIPLRSDVCQFDVWFSMHPFPPDQSQIYTIHTFDQCHPQYGPQPWIIQ